MNDLQIAYNCLVDQTIMRSLPVHKGYCMNSVKLNVRWPLLSFVQLAFILGLVTSGLGDYNSLWNPLLGNGCLMAL